MDRLTNWVSGFERVRASVLALIDGSSEEQWRWSPSPRTWSAGQCIDHLNTVNTLVVPRLEAAIREGQAQNLRAPGPFRYPWFDRLFVYALEPRAVVKQQAPGIYRPGQLLDRDAVRERFLDLQDRLVQCAEACQPVPGSLGLDLVRIKIPSPVSDRIRFSLGTWLDASLAHEQNHLEQALRLAGEPGYPGG